MTLAASSYGKGRVRVMRVNRDPALHEVRELSVNVMLQGGFEEAYTKADNRTVIATDTIKNIVNVVARENVSAASEIFCDRIAQRFLDRYPQVQAVSVATLETRWTRLSVSGTPHRHAFVLDANGHPTVALERSRHGTAIRSGIDGFTFLKSTGSGWADYVIDEYTTLPETHDRIAATSMKAEWLWSSWPEDPRAANDLILSTMLEVFATTYSHSVQDSLYRMGEAALQAVPGIGEISLSCPNKHYVPINLASFGMNGDNLVFTPTDEPHGQIECTVRR
jgi:urate oxidase